MSSQFDPEDIRSMIDYVESTEESPNSDYLLKFVENSLFLSAQAHHWHLQCNFYSTHMEFDDFYKEMPEFVDAFVEGLMAERGPISALSSSFTFLGLEKAVSTLEDYRAQCDFIHGILDEEGEYGSTNTLEDIMSHVDSVLYKLRNLR